MGEPTRDNMRNMTGEERRAHEERMGALMQNTSPLGDSRTWRLEEDGTWTEAKPLEATRLNWLARIIAHLRGRS